MIGHRTTFSWPSRVPAGSGPAIARSSAPTSPVLVTAPVDPTPVSSAENDAQLPSCPALRALKTPPPPKLAPFQVWLASILDPGGIQVRMLESGAGPILDGKLLGFPITYVGSLPLARQLAEHELKGRATIGWPPATTMLLGSEAVGVMTDPDKHIMLRRLIIPSLSPDSVATYLPDIQAAAREQLDALVAETSGYKAVPIVPRLRQYFFALVTKTALGLRLSQEELNAFSRDFEVWSANLFTPFSIDKWPWPFHEAMKARARLQDRILAMVSRIRGELSDLEQRGIPTAAGAAGSAAAALHQRSVLWRLLSERDEQGRGLTDQQVLDNLLNLMSAAQDTTDCTLTLILYEGAQRPEMLQRLRAEQQRVVAKHGPAITQAALDDMPYAHAVVMEVMRHRGVVASVARLMNEDVDLDGYLLKKGSRAIVHLDHITRSDPRWPAEGDPATNLLHPANFNPDRFMSEEGAKQGWQLPFGYGTRTCVGRFLAMAELVVFIAELARGYSYVADTCGKFKPFPSVPLPADDLPAIFSRLE